MILLENLRNGQEDAVGASCAERRISSCRGAGRSGTVPLVAGNSQWRPVGRLGCPRPDQGWGEDCKAQAIRKICRPPSCGILRQALAQRIADEMRRAPASFLKKTKPITRGKAISMRCVPDIRQVSAPDSQSGLVCDPVGSYESDLRHRRAGPAGALCVGRLQMEAVGCGAETGAGRRSGSQGVRLACTQTLRIR